MLFKEINYVEKAGYISYQRRSCSFKLADVVDLQSQRVQLNVFSLMWMLSCCLKLADVVDLKSQCVQLNVLSFMWMLSCCLKLADVVDLQSHCAQLNGLKKCLICPCCLRRLAGDWATTPGLLGRLEGRHRSQKFRATSDNHFWRTTHERRDIFR